MTAKEITLKYAISRLFGSSTNFCLTSFVLHMFYFICSFLFSILLGIISTISFLSKGQCLESLTSNFPVYFYITEEVNQESPGIFIVFQDTVSVMVF